MRTRKALVDSIMERYKRSGKKAKGKLLDEFVATTGFSRCYARRVLRLGHRQLDNPSRPLEVLPLRQGRKKKYTQAILDALKKSGVS